jgi:hypothetical protein
VNTTDLKKWIDSARAVDTELVPSRILSDTQKIVEPVTKLHAKEDDDFVQKMSEVAADFYLSQPDPDDRIDEKKKKSKKKSNKKHHKRHSCRDEDGVNEL